MDPILHWGSDVIVALQSLHGPVTDRLAHGLNFFSEELFFLVALSVYYWCFDKRNAAALAFVFLSADYLTRTLKDACNVPRPFVGDPRVLRLDRRELDASFPSAAAVSATVYWGFLAATYQRRWLWIAATTIIIVVAATRVFLGAHYPTDVAAGIAIGALVVAATYRLQVEGWLRRDTFVFAAVPLIVVLTLFHPTAETVVSLGALAGFLAGYYLEEQRVRFVANGTISQHLLKISLGLAVAMALRSGLKTLLPDILPCHFLRFAVLGFWLSFGAPALFVRLRLARAEKDDGGASTVAAT